MTIYFKGGQILFSAGAVAMSSNCCCGGCTCSTPIPPIDQCTQCAAGDFPTTYSTPRDWQIDISGVTAGSNSACSGNCTPDICSHTSFFNRSVVVSPCASQIVYTECIWLCSYYDGIAWDVHSMEMNYLEINPPTLGGNGWQGSVRMSSNWVSRLLAPGSASSLACQGLTPAFNMTGTGSVTIDAASKFSQSFSRVSPTYQQYTYDVSDCDPVACEAQNPIVNLYYGCYPAGWALTGATATTSWLNTCRNASDVTGATVSIYAV